MSKQSLENIRHQIDKAFWYCGVELTDNTSCVKDELLKIAAELAMRACLDSKVREEVVQYLESVEGQ